MAIDQKFEIPQNFNRQTQPPDEHVIFNNWSVLPEAWYFTFQSRDLKPRQIRSFILLNQKIVIFRGSSGKVHALDSFCPHMGTDLEKGKVIGDRLQCFFHHWEFDGKGLCQKIPALLGADLKNGVDHGLYSYPVEEKYGLIWIYAGKVPAVPVLDVPDLVGKKHIARLGRRNTNRSHHHISMINGLDPQHLKTVHGLSIDMQVEVSQGAQEMEFVLSGAVPAATRIDRIMRRLFGPTYSYSMKYAQASIASLTLLRNVFFLNSRWTWPRLYMLYAYRPLREGLCETQPIYVTEDRPGIWGALISRLLIVMTKGAYLFLKSEDDKVYDHIRFNSQRLLSVDRPIVRYIEFVNGLKISPWTSVSSPLLKEQNPCKHRPAATESTAVL